MSRRVLLPDDAPAAPLGRILPKTSPAMGGVKASLSAIRETQSEVEKLRTELAESKRVVELDPALVDPSFVSDRIATGDDAGFIELRELIREQGQQVPILVRQHPEHEGRYQIAYGHRRLRACRELGIRVRAFVQVLSDSDLLRAQISENAGRSDLTWAEKAVLVQKLMSDFGWSSATVQTAFAISKSEVSSMTTGIAAIPEDVIFAIGPAPKIGRPRWIKLNEMIAGKSEAEQAESAGAKFDARAFRKAKLAQAQAAIDADGFASLDTNERFNRVAAAVAQRPESASADDPSGDVLMSADGIPLAHLAKAKRGVKIVVSDARFADMLREKLREMAAAYSAHQPTDEERPKKRKRG